MFALKNRVALIFFTVLNSFFYFSEVLSNLRLPWKTEGALEFFTVWTILFTFSSFEQFACACPEKQRVPWIYCIECIFFVIQDFWATSACPEKQSCSKIFCCMEDTFYIQNFWTTCACHEKHRVPWIHYIECIFLLFRIFEQLALALKNRGCSDIFRCNEYIFYYSGVLSNLRLPWKHSCRGIFHYWIYFLHSEFLSNLRLPWKTEDALNLLYCMYIFCYSGFLSNLRLSWKTELPWNFSLYWNIFHYSGFLRNLRLPWKQSLPWNFSSPGRRPTLRLIRLWVWLCFLLDEVCT